MLITIATATIAVYPEGGGLWTWLLQYPLGLKELGHRVFWLEILPSTGDREKDRYLVANFFERLAAYGLEDDAAVAVTKDPPLRTFEQAEFHGTSPNKILQLARDGDLLWNFWYSLGDPLLSYFRRRAFIDGDPGHLHICIAEGVHDIGVHDAYLTLGTNINEQTCGIPTVGLKWRPFHPLVYLPLWEFSSDPGQSAPFTSITQWTWETLRYGNRLISVSKREAYLKYLELPQLTERPFELAANIGRTDPAGDRGLLREHGWNLVDPHKVASTPEMYREYIRRSRAEFLCPKPIHVEWNTGWFSERSAAYLATGRPVLAVNTGFTRWLPTGRGLFAFRDIREAATAVAEIDANYALHSRAAREIADAHLNSRSCLEDMIAASSS
jgi:hypothetical protein